MEASRQSREVCCCGARSWAQVIGWLQLIFEAITIVGLILYLVIAIQDKQYVEERNHGLSDDVVLFYTRWFAGLGISIAVCAVWATAGVVLVIGVRKNKTGFLMTWIVSEVFKVLVCIGWCIIAFNVVPIISIGAIIQICISIFCIWVVNEHRKEILQQVISIIGKVDSSF